MSNNISGVMLIPAHAGVILLGALSLIRPATYPRACGGDPWLPALLASPPSLSPRMRG